MSRPAPSTFRDLFDIEDFHGVEIPIIQRDYAQGRVTASDVRNQFIDALYEALTLPPNSPGIPLDLDFVYGSMDESDLGTVFSPLDGQQRLTALFLLHWYLAVHDGRLDHFQQFMCRDGCQSRFSYKVRASADDFFDMLANASFTLPSLEDGDVPETGVMTQAIEDQSWFFLAWRQDPTVVSALRVLDTIHERFKDTTDLYDRLVDPDCPVITFQFLNLHDFGLSDELYIKMNARGKALTEFEAFKARLEQKIDGLLEDRTYPLQGRQMSPKEYFGHRVDSAWADVFWHYRNGESRTFDRQFMHFVRGLVTVTFPYSMQDADSGRVNDTMRALTEHGEHFNYYRYNAEGCLTADFSEMLISVLDQLSANGHELQTFLPSVDYYDERDVFLRVLRRERPRLVSGEQVGVLQSEWVQFYGYCAFLCKYEPAPGDERFAAWMRLVSNLALNTIINRADDFIRALVSVRSLLVSIGDGSPVEYAANPRNAMSGLNKQQWREEQLKAQLMLRHSEWHDLLSGAERHGYFRGQIEFLLDFSGVLQAWLDARACNWTDDEDQAYRAAFKTQYEKAKAVFGAKGLRTFDAFAWERVLLSFGDYLLPNGRNLSLLDDRDRNASWKRLLRGSEKSDDGLLAKRNLVRSALALVEPENAQASLDRRIEEYLSATETDADAWWRRFLIECPEALQYCRQRFLRMTDREGFFLLARTRTSAYHAELRTFHLAKVALPAMLKQEDHSVFTSVEYKDVCYEASLPRVLLHVGKADLILSIQFKADRFHVQAELKDTSRINLLEVLCDQRGFFLSADEESVAGRCIPIDDLQPFLRSVSDSLRSMISEETI